MIPCAIHPSIQPAALKAFAAPSDSLQDPLSVRAAHQSGGTNHRLLKRMNPAQLVAITFHPFPRDSCQIFKYKENKRKIYIKKKLKARDTQQLEGMEQLNGPVRRLIGQPPSPDSGRYRLYPFISPPVRGPTFKKLSARA